MFGFEGKKPSRAILNFIRKEAISGVILYRRNIRSAEQLKNLTGELRDAAGRPLLIGIDQEGGRVSNLPRSIIDIPPMEEFGKRYADDGDTYHAHRLGQEVGERLKGLGINIDFAPVLDVNTNARNPIIGDRAFGSDPETVAKLGCEFVRGMMQSGIVACGKHFPGHGDTAEDSHHTLPRLPHDRGRLENIELVPFARAIKQGIPALMSAHVIYEGVDPENPATLSKKILWDILRDELSFKGVLFSDDLEMRAITDNYDIGDAAVRSISAGCDILLVCKTESLQRTALDAARRAVDNGRISPAIREWWKIGV